MLQINANKMRNIKHICYVNCNEDKSQLNLLFRLLFYKLDICALFTWPDFSLIGLTAVIFHVPVVLS